MERDLLIPIARNLPMIKAKHSYNQYILNLIAINFDFFRFNKILLYCNFNFKIELIMLYRNLLGGCYKTVYTYKPKVELNEYQIKDFKNQLEIIQDFIKEAPSLSEQEAYSKWNSNILLK